MLTIVALVLLPLAIVAAQVALGASGQFANGLYKLAFVIPPILYCRWHGIRLGRDIFRWQHGRNDLGLALILGAIVAGCFLGGDAAWGHLLIDKQQIAQKIQQQFNVTAGTVLLIAPWTILLNSLIEEFFYRGFAFGLIASRRAVLGTLLPAAVFTVQHLLFAYHWVGPIALTVGIVALFVFSLLTQVLYAKADSIVAPWIVHIAADLAMMTIAMELVFGQPAG